MHPRRVGVALSIVTVAALFMPSISAPGGVRAQSAAPVVISFEDGTAGEAVVSQYESLGIAFNGPQVGDFPGLAHSGTRAIKPCGNDDACPDTRVVMTFTRSPQVRVRLWVGSDQAEFPGGTVELRAFDSAGREVTNAAIALAPSSTALPADQPLEVVSPDGDIAVAEVRFADGFTRVLVDDVEFEAGTPAARLTPDRVDFGQVQVGTVVTTTATLTSEGSAAVSVGTVGLEGLHPDDFRIGRDQCTGAQLAPGESCTLEVEFRPGAAGERNAILVVTSSAADSPHTADLTGVGTADPPAMVLEPNPVEFGDAPVGTDGETRTVTITSTGGTALSIDSVFVEAPDAGDFPVINENCTGASLEPGSSCGVVLQFRPSAPGSRNASLVVSSNAPDSPQIADLRGNGSGGSPAHHPATAAA